MSRERGRGGVHRRIAVGSASLSGIAVLLGCGRGGVTDSRPNIVVLIADDQAAESLGAAEHPFLQTPNLDRLASEGVRFTNAFVTTSLCAPARASFLTGQYVRSHGVIDNSTPLAADAETFATLLTRAGYDSGYVGKWHIGGPRGRPSGFTYSASFAGQGRYFDCPFWINGQRMATSGHVDDVSTQLAIDFLRHPRDRPFLLVLGFKGAHAPREPPERFRGRYRDAEINWPANLNARPPFPRRPEHRALARAAGRDPSSFEAPDDWQQEIPYRELYDVPEAERSEGLRSYYETLAAVDDDVGRVLEVLDAQDLADRTLVVYVSDNGAHLYAHGMGSKRSAYEESIRIVALLRYPERVRPGTKVDELVLSVDLAPTLLDFAGLPRPERMQGEGWRGLLSGRSRGWRNAFVYEFYRGSGFQFVPSIIALRTRDKKWIEYPDRPSWDELFDLSGDPGEMSNLAGDPERRAQIEALGHRLAQLETRLGPRLEPDTMPRPDRVAGVSHGDEDRDEPEADPPGLPSPSAQ